MDQELLKRIGMQKKEIDRLNKELAKNSQKREKCDANKHPLRFLELVMERGKLQQLYKKAYADKDNLDRIYKQQKHNDELKNEPNTI